jgi:hypothetical protein
MKRTYWNISTLILKIETININDTFETNYGKGHIRKSQRCNYRQKKATVKRSKNILNIPKFKLLAPKDES